MKNRSELFLSFINKNRSVLLSDMSKNIFHYVMFPMTRYMHRLWTLLAKQIIFAVLLDLWLLCLAEFFSNIYQSQFRHLLATSPKRTFYEKLLLVLKVTMAKKIMLCFTIPKTCFIIAQHFKYYDKWKDYHCRQIKQNYYLAQG